MESKKESSWRKLDNSALLFSAVSSEKDPRVFRFYCELKAEIEEEKLQQALISTVEIYPVFLSVMRRGLFWHYLEHSSMMPIVRKEYKIPCAPLYIRDKKDLLFEVTYYQNRINLEVFHALTDGTGAVEFLRELVKQYLLVCYAEDGIADIPIVEAHATLQDQENDSFSKYYTKSNTKTRADKPKAFQLKKRMSGSGELRISESRLSVKELLAKAREHGVSMTVLLTAVYICAVHREMTKQQEKRPVILMVPVNLRNFFPSTSMLNFFAWIEPGFHFGEAEADFETVLARVKEQFKEKLTKEKMADHMNELISLERHPVLRFFPLEMKNWGIAAGSIRAERNVTAIYSNMGIVKMPAEYEPYIKCFGVYTSTPKMELCSCTFGDVLSLGFTSRFDTTNIQRNFYQILDEMGVHSEQKEPEFPENDTPKLTGVKIFKIFTFLCIVAAVCSVAINTIFTPGSFWSLIAVGGIASLWVALSVGYYKRHNLLKDAMWMLILITCGSMIWDLFTGWRGWSVDYVFPAISIAVLFSMMVITKIQSHTAREYMIYLLMAAAYSCIIPFILLMVGAVHIIYLSVISAAIGFLMVIGLMLFRWGDFKEELEKKFHV